MKYAQLNPLVTLDTEQYISRQKADGTWVSGYNLLPEKTLLDDGWRFASEVWTPCTETQVPEFDKAELLKDGSILISYKAVEIPPDEMDVLLNEMEMLV